MSDQNAWEAFHSIFKSWPQDSISSRTACIPAGSYWSNRELGTFQILREPAQDTVPSWLKPFWKEASARVLQSTHMQSVVKLFRQQWRNKTHEELTRVAGPFASFVTLLSQVLETAVVPDPQRELRKRKIHEDTLPSSSPPGSSSPSYCPSDYSDQSTHDQRSKSESTTNACIYELLRCVTELSRNPNDPSFRLEWTITTDTIKVRAGKQEYSTTNDGNLVHKSQRMGYWQRASNHSYCSIEVKSRHNTLEKSRGVTAQEAAHLVGMFSQHISAEVPLKSSLIVPLVSGAQNYFSLVLGTFPKEYEKYLQNGTQSGQGAFVTIEEYGMYKMQDPEDLKWVFTIIVALYLKLQSLGPIDGE